MSSESDEPPSRHSAGVDTGEFFLPGSGAGVSALLIHGLTGTPYEMRYLGEQLAVRGVRVRGVKLAGHAGTPEELGETGYDNWYESVVKGLEELRQLGEPIIVVGLSMGAVLAARLTADQGESIAGVVMLAPAFFLPTVNDHHVTRLARGARIWLTGSTCSIRAGRISTMPPRDRCTQLPPDAIVGADEAA